MIRYYVTTDYKGVDLSRFLRRRLALKGVSPAETDPSSPRTAQAAPDDGSAMLCIEADGETLKLWCSAISELLTRDVMNIELASIVNELPMSLIDRQTILPEAIRYARRTLGAADMTRVLAEHYSQYEVLNLEGFLRFRMGDTICCWKRCITRAAQEVLLKREYDELVRILSAFDELRPVRLKELSICLNPDGSFTLTDESDARIDYEDVTEENMLNIVLGLQPERLTVFDLSGGRCDALSEELCRSFKGRVRLYK